MPSVDRPARSRGVAPDRLCGAAARGDLGEVERLLAEGLSPDSTDEEGATPLMAAAVGANNEVVEVLLAAGADPDLQDAAGLTALMGAVISSGEMDLDGAQPLFLAVVERLLTADADVEIEDEDGCTAADHARAYGLDEMLELLEAG